MKLNAIPILLSEDLKLNPHLKLSNEETRISLISDEISKIKKNSIFVAIKGEKFDGNQWIKKAIENKTSLVIVEERIKKKLNFKNKIFKKIINKIFFVKDSRKAFSQLCAHFYNNPSKQLFCIGVTGTNGKTTVTYMLEHIFSKYFKTGIIGTINHRVRNEKTWKAKLTTPKCSELQKRLSDFVKRRVKVCAMEVSSHAISQKRIDGVSFNALIFTHFSQDHLNYHKSLKNYFSVKESLFCSPKYECHPKPLSVALSKNSFKKQKPRPFAVINRDNSFIRKLKVNKNLKIITYGKNKEKKVQKKFKNDFSFKILKRTLKGTKVEIKNPEGKKEKVFLPLLGEHNIYNATSAISLSCEAGIHCHLGLKALKNFPGVPGRFQKIRNKKKIHIFIDYAHNESGLETILKSVRRIKEETQAHFNVISLFGFGGNRDQKKRAPMTKVALKYSDQVFLTSDNPRNEDPEKIIKDGLKKVTMSEREKIFIEMDRKKAIFKSLERAKRGDVLLILGKGHENFQITKKGKRPFSDQKVIESFFST